MPALSGDMERGLVSVLAELSSAALPSDIMHQLLLAFLSSSSQSMSARATLHRSVFASLQSAQERAADSAPDSEDIEERKATVAYWQSVYDWLEADLRHLDGVFSAAVQTLATRRDTPLALVHAMIALVPTVETMQSQGVTPRQL